MRKIDEIHVFEDQAFLAGTVRMSLAVCVAGVAVGALWCAAVAALGRSFGVPVVPFELTHALGPLGAYLLGVDASGVAVDLIWWVSLAAAIVLSLALHELVHGFFFRQYAPPGARVTFGADLKMGMLYASAEGIVYTRQQYLVIALAPSIAVSLLLIALGAGLKWPLWALVATTVHLMGCTGDWGYVRALLRDPSVTHCEDTPWGVAFFGEDVPAHSTWRPADAVSCAVDVEDGGAAPARRGFSVLEGGLDAGDEDAGASAEPDTDGPADAPHADAHATEPRADESGDGARLPADGREVRP